MRKLLILAALFIAAAGQAQIAEGDAEWAKRAEGHEGGHAKAAHADAAIAAYQRAVTQNPNDLEARWKLLRAIRFKGSYVATTTADKKAIFDSGKHAGADALLVVERQLGAKGLQSASKAAERQVADAARTLP